MNRSLTQSILQRLPALHLLVLGDVFLDEYLTGDCTRISPEAPVPILKVSGSRTVLGGAANTAANIASLGGRVTLIGLIGEDAGGDLFQKAAGAAGIRFLPVKEGRPTIRKTRLLGQRQQLLRLDYEETHDIGSATEATILALFEKEVEGAQMVVLPDYAKGFFTESLTRALIRIAHEKGREVIIDPRPQHFSFYKDGDYLTPNWKESQGLLGQSECAPKEEAVVENGRTLAKKLNTHVLLTLGPQGIGFFHREGAEEFVMPTLAKEVFDVSGAGDTVVAAFSLARSAGCDFREAVTFANKAAGVVVGKLGTATLTPEELLHYGEGDGETDGAEEDGTGGRGPKRLLARADLAPLSARLSHEGKTLVTLNGSFDLLHAGHLHILEAAARQGDVLLVGLNSDASVKRYKSKDRPIIGEAHRAQMLLALRVVDYVHVFDEDVPMPFLEEAKPKVHVNGSEYGEDCIEAETVKKNGGRIHIVEKVPGLSTSEVITRIKTLS